MSNRPFIVNAAFLGIVGWASSATAQTGNDNRPPVAAPGEPPVIKTKEQGGRLDIYTQTFPHAGLFEVSQPKGTIADFYRAFDGYKLDLSAVRVPVSCRIRMNGTVVLSDCLPRDSLTETADLSLRVARTRWGRAPFPQYRNLQAQSVYVSRSVDLDLDIPAITAPTVDLTSGPLVEQKMLDFELDHRAVMNAYPSRALRKEIEGLLVIECQMQVDESVICNSLSFDPPEHLSVFAMAGERVFRSAKIQPRLKDGTDARGVRWQSRIRFQIPD